MHKLTIILLLITTSAFALTLDDAMEDVLSTKKEVCIPASKAVIQVINKTESITETVEIKINEAKKLDETLEVKVLACCNNSFQSNTFLKVYNHKNKKDIFIGWMFSVYTSLNSLEDAKFDITLLKCL